jgi:hypothetical protein
MGFEGHSGRPRGSSRSWNPRAQRDQRPLRVQPKRVVQGVFHTPYYTIFHD